MVIVRIKRIHALCFEELLSATGFAIIVIITYSIFNSYNNLVLLQILLPNFTGGQSEALNS